jgi:hypothetical protein
MITKNLGVALILAAVCGCSAPPGSGLLGGDLPAGGGPNGSFADDAGAAASPGPMSPATSGTDDGGVPVATVDAGMTETGAPPPPPPPSVFNGAGAFVSTTAADTHNAGQNCMNGCHNHGFTFAGTLTNGAGAPVAGAEVRLVDSTGAAISVFTGPSGNFHSSTPFTGAAHVGARTATKTVNMVGTITAASGGCNGCHATGGTVTPIHVP